MCGIAGILSLDGTERISPASLIPMIGVQRHRGPDESGIFVDDHIGMAHARLSIIDLASGTQPMHNENKTIWIVYNGEVFNYPELRADLEKRGHHFYSTSDTEVIVHCYEEYGPDCLNLLNGQFAIALWNTRTRELFLARDRIGIRPLHYMVHDRLLLFASEIKSLFAAQRTPREIDLVALHQVFTFWTTLPGRTVFKGINELQPGHFLRVSRGNIDVKPFWDVPFYPPSEYTNLHPQEITERIRELLLDAVRIRLRADVPVGAYLSGGLDSSGITSLVVNNFNNQISTYGIAFEEADFDEAQHQRKMAQFLNLNHHEIRVTNEDISTWFPEVIWHCEKPILRTAPVPLFLLSRLVHQDGLKVVLTGEGADEMFGGYNIFREALVRKYWSHHPDSPVPKNLIGHLYPYIFKNPLLQKTLYAFFEQGIDQPDHLLFSHLLRWKNTGKICTFFSDSYAASIGSCNSLAEIERLLPPSYQKWQILPRAQYLESKIFLSNYLLSSQGDRVAMANSLEIRLPFLDYRVMEFMGHVSPRWKIHGLNEKYILKKAFSNILPDAIANRPKHPYRAPIQQSLLSNKYSLYAQEMLSEKTLTDSGIFNPSKVAMLIKKLQSGRGFGETDGMALVGILSTQLLVNRFLTDFPDRKTFTVKPDLFVDMRTRTQT